MSHTVASGEYCQLIAQNYYITVANLESRNSQTWDWMGCNNLQLGSVICLSTGAPPMPAEGQQRRVWAPGFRIQAAGNWTNISSLNPCPLNAVEADSILQGVIVFYRSPTAPPLSRASSPSSSNTTWDGVDFDWEYPGASDIKGVPPGSPTDGPNYLSFLQLLRSSLPSNVIISTAAPASYWYLRVFPIANMSSVVTYIVYMTYDLHYPYRLLALEQPPTPQTMSARQVDDPGVFTMYVNGTVFIGDPSDPAIQAAGLPLLTDDEDNEDDNTNAVALVANFASKSLFPDYWSSWASEATATTPSSAPTPTAT
ncbi:hypothetical protein ACHAQJ_008501 [Trichoderma viride]